MPMTEDATIPTMKQLGEDTRAADIFDPGTADFGGSGRPNSIYSGVFGGAGSLSSPAAGASKGTQPKRQETFKSARPVSFMHMNQFVNPSEEEVNPALDDEVSFAKDEDYGFIDEEITRFTMELSQREPLDEAFKNALDKKKKMHKDELEDIVFDAEKQQRRFKKMIEFASKFLGL